MGNIKGNGVLTYFDYFKTTYGSDALDKIKKAMDPADGDKLFGKKILTISWVDYQLHMRFLLVADKVFGSGNGKVIEDATRWCARKDFGGIYKIFVAVASPSFLVRKVSKMWQTFYDFGTMTAESSSKNHIILTLTDVPGIPLKHELEQLSYFEEIIIMANAKKAKVTHPKCVARGDKECVFDVDWE